ncbi:MAG: leucine-rich repeat domain-containing protein, partial [Firmicutes bacterium]|nr:leucine-rich repeat domain-containing protein [Bacillota bacterium]
MKKLSILCLLALLLFAALPAGNALAASIVETGDCGVDGDSVHYTLTDDGILLISGEGKIASEAFSGRTDIVRVLIGNDVTGIGEEAFYGCSVTRVSIGHGVTCIGEGAFADSGALTDLTIGNGVTTIEYGAFYNCCGLAAVTLPDSVAYIGEEAFYDCVCLTDLTLGSGLISIGARAFYGCSGLTGLTIPDSVTDIGEGAFQSCHDLTDLTIGSGVTSIGNWAFGECTSLTSVTIPDSVTSLGSAMFASCRNLSDVTLPAGVTSLGEGMFAECTSLTSVTIPDGVTTIEGYAFYYCTSLTDVTIPASVTSIGRDAFDRSDNLTTVYYGGTAEQWANISVDLGNFSLTAASLVFGEPLAITAQPQDYTGAVGSTATFSVTARGNGLSYQWYYRKGDSGDFTKSTLACGTTPTYSMTVAERHDGWQYYCIVMDDFGNPLRSDIVTIHVAAPPAITTQPKDFTGAAGSTIKFTVKASGEGLSYQWWYRKGSSG